MGVDMGGTYRPPEGDATAGIGQIPGVHGGKSPWNRTASDLHINRCRYSRAVGGMPMADVSLVLTDRAARRIRDLVAAEGAGVMLRLAVSGGGCSGYQYGF